MEKLQKWLRDYGLNDSEIAVYLAIAQHPGAKVVDIQRHTELVRTSIYYCLAQLKAQGLVSENVQNNVKSYRAADSSALRQKIETKISEQQTQLGELDALKTMFEKLQVKPKSTDSFVARYEGAEPIKQAIEEAFRCNSKRWHVIASRDNFLFHSSKKYQQYYLAERKRRGITAKTLWEPTDGFTETSLEDVFYRNPRRLPAEFDGTFKALVILYDDTTLIIDPYERKTAHAIHNATSTHLLRLLHEFVWSKSAKITTLKH